MKKRMFGMLLVAIALLGGRAMEVRAADTCIDKVPTIKKIEVLGEVPGSVRELKNGTLLVGTGPGSNSYGKVFFLDGDNLTPGVAYIKVITDPPVVGSVRFELNNEFSTVNARPYYWPGMIKQEMNQSTRFELEVTPYQCPNRKGLRGKSKAVSFGYIDYNSTKNLDTSTSAPRVKKFVLLDLDEDFPIKLQDIKDGDVIAYEGPSAIGVVTSPTVVGSVRYEVDNVFIPTPGADAVNQYPYLLSTYLSPGEHEIEAVPYPGPDKQGVQGQGLKIKISVLP